LIVAMYFPLFLEIGSVVFSLLPLLVVLARLSVSFASLSVFLAAVCGVRRWVFSWRLEGVARVLVAAMFGRATFVFALCIAGVKGAPATGFPPPLFGSPFSIGCGEKGG
jgi:hypothetical protein